MTIEKYESIFLSRVEVEGSMSRARVPCRGSRVTFFSKFFFLEKVIIAAINVIKTNKKNLKKQMAREHLLVVRWGVE